MTASYKQKLFLYFVVIFTVFAVGIFFFEQSRERKHKTIALEEKLDAYAGMVDASLRQDSTFALPLRLFPENIRLTIIDRQGTVLFDNAITETARMENHAHRPEIAAARETGRGSDIRISASNDREYLYYAKQFSRYYIRVALPYDLQVRHFLKADKLFLYYLVALFVIILFIINIVASRFGKSIKRLRDFTLSMEYPASGRLQSPYASLPAPFPQDELGEIGEKIAENYRKLDESRKVIVLEREKLLQHVHSSEEGICFFSPVHAVEFYNGLFIQYLNTITDAAGIDPAMALTDPAFAKIVSFLQRHEPQEIHFETQIDRQGKIFAVRVNVFDDNGFEIIINDITTPEKTRQMKQEMTGNITHELRTPVTGIRGCLETILEHPLSAGKRDYFIRSAYNQVLTLSDLIRDMSLITKMEGAPQSFKLEPVGIGALLDGLKNDLEIPLQEKNIRLTWSIADGVTVKGNRNLLYSIFRNLTDNVIRYAGLNVTVVIHLYNEDKDFYYFSYADNGPGIPDEQHLNRLFERFYRITEGRTRDTGGSGLGLSIVKNAVAFHRGTIVAKNKAGGGLEFLFKLQKA
ncbi:MAG: two-component sensor histidine kinase [Prevotellaceae bacterium]|jgi:signal transduction histidine kinase|nr:two-component sensor histidine kinase [Prevotellaceae bacterium]